MLGRCCRAKTHLFSQVAHVDLIGDYHEVIGRVDTGVAFSLRVALTTLRAADIHETSWFSVL
jgi:hypothetical protein